MNIFGVCPSCQHKFSPRFKNKAKCGSCGKSAVVDEKGANILGISLFLTGYMLTYVDWRLAVLIVVILGCIGSSKLRYKAVSDEPE